MKRILVVLVSAVLLLTMAACVNQLNTKRGRGDSPVGRVDDSAKEVIQFPDRFGNVADACDGHGHRIFTTTKVDRFGYFVVLNDPSCG